METTDIIAIIIFAATGLLILFRLSGRLFSKSLRSPSIPPSSEGTAAAATSSATAAETSSIIPASAAVTKSYSWLWVIVGLVVVAVIVWWVVLPALRTSAPPAQKMTAPKKEVRPKFNLNVSLPGTFDKEKSFHSIAKVTDGVPFVFIEKKGKAYFQIETSVPQADYAIFLDSLLPEQENGYIDLEVNGVVYPQIFILKESRGKLLTIKKEMIRDKNSIAISSDSAMRINCLWLEEM